MWSQSLSCVWFFVTPWTVACQAPQSMALSQQEYWSRLPFPPSGNLPDPRKDPTCISYSPCAGRWILYHWATWEALERSVKMKSLIHVLLFATPWTVACQAPLSMGFSKQEYWSHFLLQRIFLTEGSNSGLQADSLPSESPGKSLVTFNLWQLFSLFIFYNFNIFWRHKHAIL